MTAIRGQAMSDRVFLDIFAIFFDKMPISDVIIVNWQQFFVILHAHSSQSLINLFMLRFTKSMITMILAFIPIFAGAFTVVIDAGHGGNDPGCRGAKTLEKNVTLSVARMLRDQIEKEYGKDVKVVMTRDDDSFISLQQRADIANANKADLFISIHVNSVDEKNPRRKTIEGSQVYVLSDIKTDSKSSSMKKNTDISSDKNRKKNNGGKPESIGYNVAAAGAAKLSTEFAGYTMKHLRSTAGRADMGIRQAGFQVLWSTAMPAVLVELDYMCNPDQEKYLASEKGQKECAKALSEAFRDYYAIHAPKTDSKDKNTKKPDTNSKNKKKNNKKSGNSKNKSNNNKKNKNKNNNKNNGNNKTSSNNTNKSIKTNSNNKK